MAEDNETKTDQSQDSSSVTENSELVPTDTPQGDNANKADARKKSTRKTKTVKHFPWIALTILLVIIALGAGNYWQFQQGQILKQSQARFGQQLSELADNIGVLTTQLGQTSNQQQSLAQRTEANEQGQQTLQSTLEQMSNQLKELAVAKGKEPLYWKVSEVEYLLSVANHRLMLEKDVQTAQTALQDADKRLSAIGDPGLIPIRNTVASEIGLLKQVSLPDIAGMAAKLTTVAENIEKLSFVKSARELSSIDKTSTETGESKQANFVSRVIKDITSGLFTIQRTDEPVEPLLPPHEKQYLKHNLNLKVEQARVALLNRETELFRKNLSAIETWTTKYFETQDTSAVSLLTTVEELKQVELQPSIPDISNSLRNLRTWLSQQQVANKTIKVKPSQPNLASTDMIMQSSH